MRANARVCYCIVSLLFATPSFAQDSSKPLEITAVAVSGGKINQKLKVAALPTKQLSLKLAGGKTHDVKTEQRIENLEVESAKVLSGNASGKLQFPITQADSEHGTVVATSLTEAYLKAASLTEVKVPAGRQTLKIAGKEVMLELEAQTIELREATVDRATIESPVVPVAALRKPDQTPRTTQESVSLVGDFLIFNVKVENFRAYAQPSAGPVTAPKDACFRINQEYEKPDPNNPGKTQKYVRGTFVTGAWPRAPSLMPPWDCPSRTQIAASLDPDLSYEIAKQDLEDHDRSRFGYTYGVLVAPFKYYRYERHFSAGATVGPYLGHRIHDRQGGSLIGALAIGAASATITTNNPDGTSSTSVKTGLSIALALLSEIKNDFNAGFIVGRDFFSKSDNVPISGHVWFSVSFGKKFD